MSDDQKPDKPPMVHRITPVQYGHDSTPIQPADPPMTDTALVARVRSFTAPSMRRPNGTLANALIAQKLEERDQALLTKMRKTSKELRTRAAPFLPPKKP